MVSSVGFGVSTDAFDILKPRLAVLRASQSRGGDLPHKIRNTAAFRLGARLERVGLRALTGPALAAA